MLKLQSLGAVLLVGAFAFRATATLMSPLSLEDLRERSELILHATVQSKVSERTAEGRIVTRVQVKVNEILKGELKTTAFQIVHGGGIVGDTRVAVSGQVEYTVGEEVVAFLVLNSRGEGVTLGLAQGKFRVWQDGQTGEKFAHNPFHGVTESESQAAARSATPTNQRLPLAELIHHAKSDRP